MQSFTNKQKVEFVEYIPYVFLILVFIIIIIYAYIRVKYGFWYHQPVFHFYDFRYYLWAPGIIHQALPLENKYTNLKDITTLTFDKLDDYKMNQFVNFIQTNFLKNMDNVFSPQRENIAPYFNGHGQPCFFSFFEESVLLNDAKTGETVEHKKMIGVMTTRPLFVKINNSRIDSHFDVYYVDYLCVDMQYRKKGTAPQIIQTHEFIQRRENHNISISLFKREGELTGIMPLCIYKTFCFTTDHWNKPGELHASYKFVECNKLNMHFLVDFIKNMKHLFDIYIIPDIANLLHLISSGNIYIYFILNADTIVCAYFFRRSCTQLTADKEALVLFASINSLNNDASIFIHGFKIACWKILNAHTFYGYAVVENISHTNIIINNLVEKTAPYFVTPTAYFFYNFAYPTFQANKTLIIH